MTTPIPPWQAGHTPYVTPDQLNQWPVGVSWGTIPPKTTSQPTPAQLFAVQSMICLEATNRVEEIVNQPLRATQTTEELTGPNFRATMEWSSGNGRLIAARWPVTQVLTVQVSPSASWPRTWTVLPAGSFEPEYPVDGLYGASVPSAGAGGQGILFAPGYMTWGSGGTSYGGFGWPGGQISGRKGFRVSFTYMSGFPHTSLTTAAVAGAVSLAVDDCTGWVLTGTNSQAVGAAGIIYDAMGGGQEPATITAASAVTGPGTLTLSGPTQYSHAPGIVVSAMPQSVIWASALLAGHAALTRGATATTIQTTGGKQQKGMHPLEEQARAVLNTYRRTV